jgi:cobalamin-dependent methionine synthase I
MNLRMLAEQCVAAGADVLEINTQQYRDRPEEMELAIKTVQKAADRQLCLSTNSAQTLEAGLKACKRPPIVNYISTDEVRLGQMLPLIAQYGAEAVLLITEAARPLDAEDMLKETAVLIGAANESGIPNERLLIDIGLFHITSDWGQRHLQEAMEFLRSLPEAFDPPVRSTCWVGNASAGAPRRLRRPINTTLLAMLAGLGLSSAFVDALDRETMRSVRLIRVFRNEVIYSDGEIERES